MLPPYGQSLALLTDLYQLTMACGYWKEGLADREAVFHQAFRSNPFGGAFAVAAGLDSGVRWLRDLRFRDDDLDYLRSLKAQGGQPLFEAGFLNYLREFRFRCDVDAVPEGTVVFAGEPLLRVRGPLLQAQLAETAILNIVNFQTLIATKAARVCLAAGEDPVLEFGLRRAQGIDGGLSASRAAYVGGCTATSNVLAGKLYGIPVRGTHAHSWVLAFETEAEAFDAFARAMPHNCVLLVDTYNTMEGVSRAVDTGIKMRAAGLQLAAIRLDSGDLAQLSAEARKLLDAAGLRDTRIVASNDLDEHSIADLKSRGAPIGVWGVGTSIAAAVGQSALAGVYKLALLRDASGRWEGKTKLSDSRAKASIPGMLQVRRFADDSSITADVIYDELRVPQDRWRGVDPSAGTGETELIGANSDLLQPVLRSGRPVAAPEALAAARERCRSQLEGLPAKVRQNAAGSAIPVFLETELKKEWERLARPRKRACGN